MRPKAQIIKHPANRSTPVSEVQEGVMKCLVTKPSRSPFPSLRLSPGSPDRVDALVWALTELMLGSPGENLLEYCGGLQAEKAAGDKGSL